MVALTSGKCVQRAGSCGVSFMPHEINVCAGEDVGWTLMSFSHERRREIRVLSAQGTISDVSLIVAGDVVSIPGHFQILSLSGTSKPAKINGAKDATRSQFIASLAAADGRVITGIVAFPFTALSPVKVVVHSYIPITQHVPETKPTTAAETK